MRQSIIEERGISRFCEMKLVRPQTGPLLNVHIYVNKVFSDISGTPLTGEVSN